MIIVFHERYFEQIIGETTAPLDDFRLRDDSEYCCCAVEGQSISKLYTKHDTYEYYPSLLKKLVEYYQC